MNGGLSIQLGAGGHHIHLAAAVAPAATFGMEHGVEGDVPGRGCFPLSMCTDEHLRCGDGGVLDEFLMIFTSRCAALLWEWPLSDVGTICSTSILPA